MILWLHSGAPHLYASKDYAAPNPGFVTEFAAAIEDVLQALAGSVAGSNHSRYREPTLESTLLFEPWKGEGKVFYKIRTDAKRAGGTEFPGSQQGTKHDPGGHSTGRYSVAPFWLRWRRAFPGRIRPEKLRPLVGSPQRD
jgi:hypothetical protein